MARIRKSITRKPNAEAWEVTGRTELKYDGCEVYCGNLDFHDNLHEVRKILNLASRVGYVTNALRRSFRHVPQTIGGILEQKVKYWIDDRVAEKYILRLLGYQI